MLKRGVFVFVFVLVFAFVVVVAMRGRGSESTSESESGRESESESARGSEGERESTPEGEPESEREVEIAHDHEIEQTRLLVERLAEIRGEVHLLEMQRLDAHARHDPETEARLDAEIAALRAQNDHLRGVTASPEGI